MIRSSVGMAVVGGAIFMASAFSHASFISAIQAFLTQQREASAFAITTKQTALAANQRNTAQTVAAQQLTTATGAIAVSNRIIDAQRDFSSRLGQPDDIKCNAQAQRTMVVEAASQSGKDRSKLMASFANARVGSQAEADRQRTIQRLKRYCSQSEAKVGICELTANGMQSWDSSYAGAFNERTLSPEAELAGYDYAAMVSDVRAPVQVDCTGSSCEAAQAAHMEAVAMASMSAFALVGQVADRRSPVLTGE